MKVKTTSGVLFVVFCPEVLAIIWISGTITTNLGKSATRAKIAGCKKSGTSLQNIPLSLKRKGYFFVCLFFNK